MSLEDALRPAATAPDDLTNSEATGEVKVEQRGIALDFISAAAKTKSYKGGLVALQGLLEVAMGKEMDDRKLVLEAGVVLLQK